MTTGTSQKKGVGMYSGSFAFLGTFISGLVWKWYLVELNLCHGVEQTYDNSRSLEVTS